MERSGTKVDGGHPSNEQVREWMMAALDGECSQEQRQALENALAASAKLKQEWDEMQQVKEITQTMSMRKPPDEVWQGYWQSVYVRLERGFAWVLISLGTLVVLGWGIWQTVQKITADTDLPVLIKVALVAMIIGLAALLISVLREKLFMRKSDPYKDIQR
jgi:ferric-dicitrate binding protein FerR (iron transport regulator)